MDTEPIPHLHEKVLAGNLLHGAAGAMATGFDRFGSWLLAGFGAAFALFVSNPASLTPVLEVRTLRCAIAIFLVAMLVGVVHKYVAAVTLAAVECGSIGERRGEELGRTDVDLVWRVVFAEMGAAIPWSMRRIVERSLGEVMKGDFARGGRLAMRWAYALGVLVVVEALLLLSAGGVIVVGLTSSAGPPVDPAAQAAPATDSPDDS